MERRYEPPTTEDFAACEVSPELSEPFPKQFRELATPFGDLLDTDSQRYYFHAVLEGLAAHGRKNLESIALFCRRQTNDIARSRSANGSDLCRTKILGPPAHAQPPYQTSRTADRKRRRRDRLRSDFVSEARQEERRRRPAMVRQARQNGKLSGCRLHEPRFGIRACIG